MPAIAAAGFVQIVTQALDDAAFAKIETAVRAGTMLELVQALGLFLAYVVTALLIQVAAVFYPLMAITIPRLGTGRNGTEGDDGGGKGKKFHRGFSRLMCRRQGPASPRKMAQVA